MDTELLRQKIAEVVQRLRLEDKQVLAEKIKETWSMTVVEYSKSLYEYEPQNDMEPELIEAFQEEFVALGIGEQEIERALHELKKHRTIQTSAHTEIAPPSRRFCIDWMSTRGLPRERPYIIGAFSGVPFSNKSKPGRISYTDTRVNFIPKTHQDALVFSTAIPEKTQMTHTKLPETISEVVPKPIAGESFSTWASQSEKNILEKTLKRDVVVFDINNVVTRYLVKILPNTEHPLHKLLIDPSTTKSVLELFGKNLHFFYTPYETKKYTKQESMYYLDGYGFTGDHEKCPHDVDELVAGLKQKKLCPATLLVFTSLAFLNDFQCFGSFVQVEYLSKFKSLWQESGLLGKNLDHIPTNSLTTCMFPENPNFQCLDLIVSDTAIPGKETDLLGAYYLPIWQQDLYYTNKLT